MPTIDQKTGVSRRGGLGQFQSGEARTIVFNNQLCVSRQTLKDWLWTRPFFWTDRCAKAIGVKKVKTDPVSKPAARRLFIQRMHRT